MAGLQKDGGYVVEFGESDDSYPEFRIAKHGVPSKLKKSKNPNRLKMIKKSKKMNRKHRT